jgi:serine protease Do
MRYTDLLVVAAAAGVVTTAASAQESRPSAERVRVTTPRVFGTERNGDGEHRAALGLGTSTTGTLRDTLGLMITSVTKGSPAEKAGLEEGNRLSSINGVSLRANPADVEDGEMSGALTRRLQRELAKSKAGDEVELRIYKEGHSQTVKVRTADADSLFKRVEFTRSTRAEMENRPALGFSLGSSGSRRDTLGVLVMSVLDSTPAAKAGLEEGNRIAAIGGVNLRVSREDAGDRWLASSKAQRLQREIAALKPGDNVTLKVYSEGKFRDVTLKVARAGDLPKGQGGMMFLGDGFPGAMPAFPAMPPVPRMAPLPPGNDYRLEIGPELRESVEGARMQLERVRPQLERIGPEVRMELDRIRPQLERLRMELPAMAPRMRGVNVIV